MSARCKLCQQELPGVEEPQGTGAVVSCSCGTAYARKRNGVSPWSCLTEPRAGGCQWTHIVANHIVPGHTLIVAWSGSED